MLIWQMDGKLGGVHEQGTRFNIHFKEINTSRGFKTMEKARILVVEDEEIVAADICMTLISMGYEVVGTASSGAEAIRLVAKYLPDLVLMDIVLKGPIDGVAVAEQIGQQSRIPVIYLTAFADEATLERARITDPFGYILKPFQARELNIAIELALYKSRQANKLRDLERWLATTLRSIGDGVITADLAGNITYLNPVAEALTGWKQPEAMGKPLQEVFKLRTEAADFKVESWIAGLIATGKPLELPEDALLETREQRLLPVSANAAPLQDEEGKISGTVLVFKDVSERRQLEKSLAAEQHQNQFNNQFLQAIMEALPVGVTIIDRAGQVINQNVEARTIWSDSQVSVNNLQDYARFKAGWIGSDQLMRQNDWGVSQTLSSGEASLNQELFFETEKGKPKIILNSVVPIRDDTGAVTHAVAVSQDITQRTRTEEAIHKSEERLRLLIETNMDGMLQIDQAGQISFANQAAEQILNLTSNTITSRKYNDPDWKVTTVDGAPFPEEDLPFSQVRRTGKTVFNITQVIEHPDGKQVILDVNAAPMRSITGEITGVLCTVRDVTRQRLLEANLRELQERFESAFTYTAVGMALVRLDGSYLQVNPAFCDLLGYSKNELLERSFQDITYPPDLEIDIENIEKLLSGQANFYEMEKRYVNKTGQLIWAWLTRSLVRDSEGRPLYFITQSLDITRRKEIEQALRESEQKYRLLARNFPKGAIILFDRALRFIVAEGENLIEGGRPNQYYIGKTLWEAFSPDQAAQLAPHYQAALAGQEYGFQHEVSQSGKIYNTQVVPIKNDLGEVTAGMLVSQDITELSRANRQILELNLRLEQRVQERTEQLAQANQELVAEIQNRARLEQELKIALYREKELNELKNRFISMTSHEFRTPLSIIQSSAELLRLYGSHWTEDKKNELFERIDNATIRMVRLLDDVLLIGNAQSGNLKLSLKSMDLVNFCRNIVTEIKSGPEVRHEINFIQGVPSLIGLFDEKLLWQIVSNLLSNALKYSPDKQPVYLELDNWDQEAVIIVRDKGMGIPPEDLPRLFDDFHRGTNVGTIQGTGLGLAIVKQSVEIHGGSIAVESKLGFGSTFIVKLPVRE